jgi:hypothetical protein
VAKIIRRNELRKLVSKCGDCGDILLFLPKGALEKLDELEKLHPGFKKKYQEAAEAALHVFSCVISNALIGDGTQSREIILTIAGVSKEMISSIKKRESSTMVIQVEAGKFVAPGENGDELSLLLASLASSGMLTPGTKMGPMVVGFSMRDPDRSDREPH